MSALAEIRAELASNEAQWEAFRAAGHCMVVAPPGSGKTKLLTARLAQDFLGEIREPHGAACITYSNSAAEELDRRLLLLGVQRRSNLFVGTVHRFALNCVIRPYAAIVGLDDVADATVATAEERARFFDDALYSVYDRGEDVFAVDTTMARRRRHMVVGDDPMFGGERVARVTSIYEDLLRSAGLIDFEDMVRTAVEIVEGHAFVRHVLAARFPKLFIDEYQDLGPGLHHLVKALCFDEGASSTLFGVADPDQCIYVFTGAAPELVDEVANRHDVHDIRLRINYRCATEIIRQSLTALDEPLDVEGEREGGVVEIHQVEGGIQGQATRALSLIETAISAHTPKEEIAALCLSNADCQTVAEVLRDANVPVFVRSADEYPRTPATALVEGLAAWATSPRGESGLTLAELLRRWRALLGPSWERQRDVALVEVLLDYEVGDERNASDLVGRVAELGLVGELERRQERQEDADAMKQMVRDLSEGVLQDVTVAELGDRALARNRVHVLTMHGSKGLEFDIVCLLGLEGNRLPWWNATGWEVVQARRQFYVALTRARVAAHLYYTGWHRDKYGRRWDDRPSRFVLDLDLD